jgi:hypothetical protein
MTDTFFIPPLRDLPTGHSEVRKQHLLAEIAREPERPRTTNLRLRLRLPLHRRRWQVAAVALTAAAAVAVGVTMLLPSNGGGLSSAGRYIHRLPRVSTSEHGGPRLASVVLLRAARTAASQPATALGPGQFIYTKTQGFEFVLQGVNWAFRPVTRETWTARDGSGRLRELEGHLRFATQADAAYFYDALRNQQDILNGHSSDSTVAPGGNSYLDLSKAPTDPAKLKRLIESRKVKVAPEPPGNADTFQAIEDLLRYTYAPPAVRSALYTIASQLPGVQLIGPTQDPLGRRGIAVAYGLPQPQGRASKVLSNELIFDPQTSALLAKQIVVTQRTKDIPFSPGTVIASTAYITSGIVNSTSATTSPTP